MFVARFCDLLDVEITCDGCGITLPGRRYRCVQCIDMDLCTTCYSGELTLSVLIAVFSSSVLLLCAREFFSCVFCEVLLLCCCGVYCFSFSHKNTAYTVLPPKWQEKKEVP